MKTPQNYIALYHLARQLHGLSANGQMQLLVNKAAETSGAQQVCLALLNPDQSLRSAYALETAHANDLWQPLLDHGLAGYVYHGKRTVIVRNIARDPRWSLRNNPLTQGSAVGLPLYDGDSVFGVLLLIHHSLDHFSTTIVEMLEEIAALASDVLPATLEREHTQYHYAFETALSPMILVHPDGIIADVNRETITLLGYRPRDIIGLHISEVHRGRGGKLSDEQRAILHNGREITFETVALTHTGELVPVRVRARAVNFDGTPYILFIGQDLSEQMALDQLRSDLSAMVYHDLRGPLQTVQLSIQKLGQVLVNHESDAVRILLQTGIRSTRQLSRMIDSLLDIQRLEQGQTITNRRETNLRVLLGDAVQLVQPLALESNMSLRFELANNLPALSIDEDMIVRVVTNLLENAIKYTQTGGKIILSAAPTPDAEAVVISICDSGPGIPDTMKAKIFDKFSRVKHQDAPKGVGLGLAFCKLAVEAHGGNIWVEDAPETGSAFMFRLPLTRQTAQA